METFLSAYATADFFGKLIFISLFALSVICWSYLIHRVWLILKMQKGTQAFFERAKKASGEILQLQLSSPHPFSEIHATLKEKTGEVLEKNHYFENVYLSTSDMELIESHIDSTITQEKESIEKNFFILATTVTLAPFLGLLGTVWGILITFGDMKSGGSLSSSTVILSGLSTALTTTVLGLLIAIPALIAHNYLKNASKNFYLEMSRFSHLLLSTVELQYRNPKER